MVWCGGGKVYLYLMSPARGHGGRGAWRRLSQCQKGLIMICFVVGDRFDLLLQKQVRNGEVSVSAYAFPSPDRSPTSQPSFNRQVLGDVSTYVHT